MNQIKKILPSGLLSKIRPFYHGFCAYAGDMWFGRPSRRLVVIGVTGTNGKTTTVNLIARILEEAGQKTGYTSTATISLGGPEHLNTIKMTMPSGWVLHKSLRRMADAGCKYAVLEVSSEGLAQNRHKGIRFDAAVFTNLTPEHVESHGSFENYKAAKGKLFSALRENSGQKAGNVPLKTIIVNADDSHASYYASFPADRYITYGVRNPADVRAERIEYSPHGISFFIDQQQFVLQLLGRFDVPNALAAIAAARSQGVSYQAAASALKKVPGVPGRMELLQREPFGILVDYAYEPEEMRQLYETVAGWPHGKIIQVLGPTGGGRDKNRIAELGRMAGTFADAVVITTDDPYDENPKQLAGPMVLAATAAGKEERQTLFFELDRRRAISKALSLAAPGDMVLITGKGADQKMALAGGRYAEWDDRNVAREEYKKMVQ